MVHKRSPKAFVRRLRIATAFRDRELAETVCTATQISLSVALTEEYGEKKSAHALKKGVLGDIQRADVLIDSRGRGVLQQIPL